MSGTQTPIEIGTMVSTVLYNRGRGYVRDIHGCQRPDTSRSLAGRVLMTGGSAAFDIVFEDGHVSMNLPEAIIRGVQWRVYSRAEGFADAAHLDALASNARAIAARRQEDADRAAAAFEAERAALDADPAYAALIRGNTGDGVLAARNMRLLLKAAFPGVTFSVRKADYGTIRVSWTDGPQHEAVEAIVLRFKTGRFDSQTDYAYEERTPWTVLFGHARYVFTARG